MPNGIWNKATYLMDVPEADQKRAAMTFDMLEDIHKNVCQQPDKCNAIMDDKIKTNNKTRRKINLGIGGGGAAGAYGILELLRSLPKWWNGG